MHAEIEAELNDVAHNISTILEVAYPGDYHLEGESAYRLYKGDHDLTTDYSLIDRVKTDTDMDITLFYQDTRILTTIVNSSSNRIIGTGAPEIVFDHTNLEESLEILETLLSDIRAMENSYNDQNIQVTMTFGLSIGGTGDIRQMIREADAKLYEGKAAGRDRILL